MTKTKKITMGLLSLSLAATACAGVAMLNRNVSFAEDDASGAKSYADFYYGSQLTDPVSQKLYDSLLNADLKSGNSIRVEDEQVSLGAAQYALGNTTLSSQFDAAFGSFYYDHTDYFYLDPQAITLSVAKGNGGYVVEIGGGRSGSYFTSGVTKDNVDALVNDYQTKLDALVQTVKDDLAARDLAAANAGLNTWTYWNAFCANDAVTKAVTYSFCKDDTGKDTAQSAFIRTAYGALVNKKAVCEGYTRLFKAVMDKLGFKCVIISGAGIGEDGVEPHAWNAVYDETKKAWYGMDVTWNDVEHYTAGDYIMISGTVLGFDHDPNPVISASGYSLTYPVLAEDKYESDSGEIEVFYTQHTLPYFGDEKKKVVAVRYKGMNYSDAMAQGYYIAIRYTQGTTVGPWMSFKYMNQYANYYMANDANYSYHFCDNDTIKNMEIAVFDIPDDSLNAITKVYDRYTQDAVENHMIDKLIDEIPNPSYDPTYVAPSYIKSIVATGVDENGKAFRYTDWQTRKQDIADGMMHITVEYVQQLERIDPEQEISVKCDVSIYTLDPRTIDLDDIWEYATLKNISFEGNKVEFDFMPSPLYQHNGLVYTFELTNAQTHSSYLSEGQKAVKPCVFRTVYAYADTYICTKCLGGGRYLIDNAYSSPVLVSDGDLSTEGWSYKDKDGTTHMVSESQRSNLALVVTKPTNAIEENSEKGAEEQVKKLDLPAEAEVTSSTYEVDLNICGRIVSIPDGSYLKINLGFPKGVSYDNLEGVVFKLYHFKRDASGKLNYDEPEEIECIITPYGIVATVTSFSPYTLVTIKNAPESLISEAAAKKGITTKFDNVGGKISSSTGKLTDSIEEGGSITYTLYAEEGYEIEYALLNSKPVAVVDGQVKIDYADLEANNIFSCGFVATAVKEEEEQNHVETLTVQNIVYAEILSKDSTANVEELVVELEQDISGETPSVAEYVPPTQQPDDPVTPPSGGNTGETGDNPSSGGETQPGSPEAGDGDTTDNDPTDLTPDNSGGSKFDSKTILIIAGIGVFVLIEIILLVVILNRRRNN